MPGPRALGIPGGAQDRDEGYMPSGPVDGESDGHAHILYPPVAGPGGGSSSRGRAFSQR